MVQIFELEKGRVFISGLFWQPLPGVSTAAKKAEIEKIAAEQGFDFVVTRTTGAFQGGFCSLDDGAKPGMLSIAAMVSKTIEVEGLDRNLLCVTELENGRWLYIAQREGVILPDGDMIGGEDEVRSRMLEDLSVGEWGTIFAPDHWGVVNSQARKFKDFIPKSGSKVDYKKWWGLRPVKSNVFKAKGFWPIVIMIIVAVGGFYGYAHWKKMRMEKELAEFQAQQASTSASQQLVKLEHPWKTIPRASSFASACSHVLNKNVSTLWPGGWVLGDISCKDVSLNVRWAREPNGWINQILGAVPKATISPEGANANIVLPVDLPTGEDETLLDEKTRTMALLDAAQRNGYKFSLTIPAATIPLPGDKSTLPQQGVKDWKEFAWAVKDLKLPPGVFVEVMDGPGFRVSSIKTFLVDGVMNWEMEGIQYVQP